MKVLFRYCLYLKNLVINQKTYKYKKDLFEFSWIVVGKGLSFAGMLFLVGILTRSLTINDYAILALGLTFCNLANQAVMGSISQGISRYFSIALESGGYHSFKNAAIKVSGLSLGILLVPGILLPLFFLYYGRSDLVVLTFGLIILSAVNGLNDIFYSMQNLARNRMYVAITGGIDAWLKVFLVAIALNFMTASTAEVIFCYIATALIVLLLQIKMWKKFHKSLAHGNGSILNWEKSIWKFSLPASIWGVFVWFQQASDRWALQFFSSANDVAQYSVLYQIGYFPLIMGIGLLVTMCTPILYSKSKVNDSPLDTYNHKIIIFLGFLTLIVTAVAFIFLWLLSDHIMRTVTAPAYYSSGSLLPWMALGAGAFAFADVLYIKMMGEIRVKEILCVKVLVSLIGVIYNSFGAYYFGLRGVVAANLLFGVTYLLIIYIASSNKFRFYKYF